MGILIMKFDIALHEKPKKLPQWFTVGGNGQEYERITAKLAQKYIPSYEDAEKKILIKKRDFTNHVKHHD